VTSRTIVHIPFIRSLSETQGTSSVLRRLGAFNKFLRLRQKASLATEGLKKPCASSVSDAIPPENPMACEPQRGRFLLPFHAETIVSAG
jgi:hypothetical protein